MQSNHPVLGADPPPDWDALWRDADLPDEDRDAWREVMKYRTRFPDDAVKLAQHGWTWCDVVDARSDPGRYWPDLRSMAMVPGRRRDLEETAALLLLADETAKYHESQASLARHLRRDYVKDLSENTPKGDAWSYEAVAKILGLTRQRIRAIARSKHPSP